MSLSLMFAMWPEGIVCKICMSWHGIYIYIYNISCTKYFKENIYVYIYICLVTKKNIVYVYVCICILYIYIYQCV
jgi:hypothetical protein